VFPTYRVYNLAQLQEMFLGFQWKDQAFFHRIGTDWLPDTSDNLASVPSSTMPVHGVAVLNLVKVPGRQQ
jgi:hypothetical protein